ncbi:hypothetical protein LINPERPRIM_LOCUS22681, partial [Linum perenne]
PTRPGLGGASGRHPGQGPVHYSYQPAYQNGGAYLMGAGSSLVGHPQLQRLRSFRVWTSSSMRLDPDSQGRCLAAFSMNLGKCSITRAELRGALSVLQLAWERGYRKIQQCAV